MPNKKDRFFAMLKGGFEEGGAAARLGMKSDADLFSMLKGKEVEKQNASDLQAEGIKRAQEVRAGLEKSGPGKRYNVSMGAHGPTISESEQLPRAPGSLLTPAVKKNEEKWGEKVNHFETGGKPQFEESISKLERNFEQLGGKIVVDPATGKKTYADGGESKRDGWDRTVGGALNDWPTLQGLLAPTEKSRADNLKMIAAQGVRAVDPQPASTLIEAAQSGVYDPTSTDQLNRQKILDTLTKQQAQAAQVSEGARRMHATGYASKDAAQAEGLSYDDQGDDPNEEMDLHPEYDGSTPPPAGATPEQKEKRKAFLRSKAGR